jgi:acetyltransferase-like isoleucine patch superfamily enzyme
MSVSFKKLKEHSLTFILQSIHENGRQSIVTGISNILFRLKCLLSGCSCGENLEVYGNVILRSKTGNIKIGDGVKLISSSWRSSTGALNHPVKLRTFSNDAKIVIESDCGLNGTCIISRSTVIHIGAETIIAPNVTIMDSDFHTPWPPEKRMAYSGSERDAPVTIGKRVWIGANSIILKGVTIGNGAVIGAGSIVVKDIPPNVMAAGNPARVVKEYDVIASSHVR